MITDTAVGYCQEWWHELSRSVALACTFPLSFGAGPVNYSGILQRRRRFLVTSCPSGTVCGDSSG